jgi:hypothetical protein
MTKKSKSGPTRREFDRVEGELYLARSRITEQDKKIHELRRELYEIAPYEIRELLDIYSVPIDGKPYAWEREAIARIVANTHGTAPSGQWNISSSDRAPCPLCHGTPDSQAGGYALPLGLERHLGGFGTIQRCPVLRAAIDLVLDRLKRIKHNPGSLESRLSRSNDELRAKRVSTDPEVEGE